MFHFRILEWKYKKIKHALFYRIFQISFTSSGRKCENLLLSQKWKTKTTDTQESFFVSIRSQTRKDIELLRGFHQIDSVSHRKLFHHLQRVSEAYLVSYRDEFYIREKTRSSIRTFKVTCANAGTSSVFGLESLRELRVQGADGMGNGLGPSLTHGGRKVVLCGGWPPAPGIFAQRLLRRQILHLQNTLQYVMIFFAISYVWSLSTVSLFLSFFLRLYKWMLLRNIVSPIILPKTCTLLHWRAPGPTAIHTMKVGISRGRRPTSSSLSIFCCRKSLSQSE